MTADDIHQIMPHAPAPRASALIGAMEVWRIDTPDRAAAFLAQIAVESLELTRIEENLEYSAEALLRIWPSHFSVAEAARFASRPVAIANRVYANRMGNGDEQSGDGWRFRGRGAIQITGRINYVAAGNALKQPLVHVPDLALTPEVAAASACWYWRTQGLNELADAGRFEEIVRRVNGGLNDYEQRLAYFATAKRVFMKGPSKVTTEEVTT